MESLLPRAAAASSPALPFSPLLHLPLRPPRRRTRLFASSRSSSNSSSSSTKKDEDGKHGAMRVEHRKYKDAEIVDIELELFSVPFFVAGIVLLGLGYGVWQAGHYLCTFLWEYSLRSNIISQTFQSY